MLLVPDTVEVCAVVSGGSNLHGWERWDGATKMTNDDDGGGGYMPDEEIRNIVSRHVLVLLQCEVPDNVNLRLARACRMMGVGVLRAHRVCDLPDTEQDGAREVGEAF